MDLVPPGNYMLKVDNRCPRTRCEICSKLTIKTPERRQWSVFSHIRNEYGDLSCNHGSENTDQKKFRRKRSVTFPCSHNFPYLAQNKVGLFDKEKDEKHLMKMKISWSGLISFKCLV